MASRGLARPVSRRGSPPPTARSTAALLSKGAPRHQDMEAEATTAAVSSNMVVASPTASAIARERGRGRGSVHGNNDPNSSASATERGMGSTSATGRRRATSQRLAAL